MDSLERRVKALEEEIRRMNVVHKGIESTTRGWDGGHLTLYKLTATDSIDVEGDLTVSGDLALTGSIDQDAWVDATLQNSWVAYGTPFSTLQYRKDRQGRVWLQGTIKDGTATEATVLTTLPAGFRPPSTKWKVIPIGCNVIGGTIPTPQVAINDSGEVLVYGAEGSAYLHIYGNFALD